MLCHKLFSLFLFSVDTDVDADVDRAGCQRVLTGSRVEIKASFTNGEEMEMRILTP